MRASLILKALTASCAIFILDALSKAWIAREIVLHRPGIPWYPYGGIPVFENFLGIEFSIVHLVNKGAAWGILPHFQEYLLIFRLLLIAAMILYLFFFNSNDRTVLPFSLIIAGAAGNVADTFIYGHVIDMIHFVFWRYDFPAFNVADSAICVGVAWLFLLSFFSAPSKNKTPDTL